MKRLISCCLLLSSLSLSGCFQTRSEIAEEKQQQSLQGSLQQSLGEQSQSIEELQQHLGVLQGRIEELDHSRKSDSGLDLKNQDELNKKIAALITRLDALEQKQDLLFNQVTKIQQDSLQAPKAEAATGTQSTQKKSEKIVNHYEAGLAAYKGRHYAEAAGLFEDYLKISRRPKHLIEANYFLGESYYQQKNYKQAILAYSVLHEKTPKTAFGRKSTLRIAESFHAMGNKKDCIAFAQILVDSQPGSDEAKVARKYLK